MPHGVKSVIIPTQILHHLGFILNSLDMTVSIFEEKHAKLKHTAQKVLDKKSPTIREVARLIGMMISCFPGVEYGELSYRQLEIEKAAALKASNWVFENTMQLSETAKSDITWWIMNSLSSKQRIDHGKIGYTLYTDASNQGWGATLNGLTTGGRWSASEATHHINYLELKAIFLGLQALCKKVTNDHIKVTTDNTTAVAYIRNMGAPTLFYVATWLNESGNSAFHDTYGLLSATYQGKLTSLQKKHLGCLMIQPNGCVQNDYSCFGNIKH